MFVVALVAKFVSGTVYLFMQVSMTVMLQDDYSNDCLLCARFLPWKINLELCFKQHIF